MSRKSRGCRGKGSKRRSREKWLLKIGAAYAHHEGKKHCGLGATRCAGRSAHRVTATSGAATEDLWSGTTQKEAKRQGIARRPTECAMCALAGAADSAHHEDAAMRAAAEAGDAVVGQRGNSDDLTTPAVKVNGEEGEPKIATIVTVVAVALVLWWESGWCAVSALSLAVAAASALWLDRQLGQWLADDWTGIAVIAAVKSLLGGPTKLRLTRHRKAKIEHAWKRVLRIMIERGVAGELPQSKLQVKQLKAQLAKAQGMLGQVESKHSTEKNKLRNDRSRVIAKAKERHFLAGRLEGLREALPMERENQELKVQLAQQAQQFNEKLLRFQQQLQAVKAERAVLPVAAVVSKAPKVDLAAWLMVGLPGHCWRFRSDYVWDKLLEHNRDRADELGFGRESWNRQLGGQHTEDRQDTTRFDRFKF